MQIQAFAVARHRLVEVYFSHKYIDTCGLRKWRRKKEKGGAGYDADTCL
jgi:hypothetical protein